MATDDTDGLLALAGVAVAALVGFVLLSNGDGGAENPIAQVRQTVESATESALDSETETDDQTDTTPLQSAADAIQAGLDTALGDVDETVGGAIGAAGDNLGVGGTVDSIVSGFDAGADEALAVAVPEAGAVSAVAEGVDDTMQQRAETRETSRQATNTFREAGVNTVTNTNPDTGGRTTGTADPVIPDSDVTGIELSDRAQDSNLSEEDKDAFRNLSV